MLLKVGTGVSLASGEHVYVNARSADVRALFRHSNGHLVTIGRQAINPAAVARIYDCELAGRGEPEELAQPL